MLFSIREENGAYKVSVEFEKDDVVSFKAYAEYRKVQIDLGSLSKDDETITIKLSGKII